MSRYQHARQRTEHRLIQAAITCLFRDGYENLSITAIAQEADVGRGTFYAYFADADAVLLAICKHYFFNLQAEIHTMMEAYDSPEKEQRAWLAAFQGMTQLKAIVQMLNHASASQLVEQFQDVMIQGFKQSLETNAFLYPQWMNLPTDVMATFTAGAVMAVVRKWLNGDLPYPAEDMAGMVYQLLYHQPSG